MELKHARRVIETALADQPGFIRAAVQMGENAHVRVEIRSERHRSAIAAALPPVDVPVRIVTSKVVTPAVAH